MPDYGTTKHYINGYKDGYARHSKNNESAHCTSRWHDYEEGYVVGLNDRAQSYPQQFEKAEWYDMKDMPQSGTFLVVLEEVHKLMGSDIGIMMKNKNVSFINGMFAFDTPKPIKWKYLPRK